MTANSLRHSVTISNPQGFHMRPIQAFVAVANRFPGTVTVARSNGGDPPVNGKSMLMLMSLGAEQGTELFIEVTGDGAADILPALVDVIHHNYDDE